MSGTPKISVIIPVYNAADTVRESVESVLKQTFSDYELIIVDDASTDNLSDTLGDIGDPRIRLIKHPENKGAAAARNTGIQATTGDYIAFLDSDDVWYPEKLRIQYDFMAGLSDRDVKASCTSFTMQRLNKRKRNRILKASRNWTESLFGGCHVSPGTTLMAERHLFSSDDIGPFPEDMKRLEDWEWLLRYARKYKLGVVQDILAEIKVTGYPAYETVSLSAEQLYEKQTAYIAHNFGRKKLKLFHAGLYIEKAGAAFRKKMYVQAVKDLTKAVLISPTRVWALIKRIAQKLIYADHSFRL